MFSRPNYMFPVTNSVEVTSRDRSMASAGKQTKARDCNPCVKRGKSSMRQINEGFHLHVFCQMEHCKFSANKMTRGRVYFIWQHLKVFHWNVLFHLLPTAAKRLSFHSRVQKSKWNSDFPVIAVKRKLKANYFWRYSKFSKEVLWKGPFHLASHPNSRFFIQLESSQHFDTSLLSKSFTLISAR